MVQFEEAPPCQDKHLLQINSVSSNPIKSGTCLPMIMRYIASYCGVLLSLTLSLALFDLYMTVTDHFCINDQVGWVGWVGTKTLKSDLACFGFEMQSVCNDIQRNLFLQSLSGSVTFLEEKEEFQMC